MSPANRQAPHRILCWSLWSTLAACTFEAPAPFPVPITSPITTTPFAPIVDSGEQKLFEQPGEMVVYHGFACAESKESDRQNFLRVQQSRALEERLDRATVFLSGWQFRYLNGDHEIAGLGTGIFRIRREGTELRVGSVGRHHRQQLRRPRRRGGLALQCHAQFAAAVPAPPGARYG